MRVSGLNLHLGFAPVFSKLSKFSTNIVFLDPTKISPKVLPGTKIFNVNILFLLIGTLRVNKNTKMLSVGGVQAGPYQLMDK